MKKKATNTQVNSKDIPLLLGWDATLEGFQ